VKGTTTSSPIKFSPPTTMPVKFELSIVALPKLFPFTPIASSFAWYTNIFHAQYWKSLGQEGHNVLYLQVLQQHTVSLSLNIQAHLESLLPKVDAFEKLLDKISERHKTVAFMNSVPATPVSTM